jgi:two-component system nitrogen regulation sensor histidine kinase NtrY
VQIDFCLKPKYFPYKHLIAALICFAAAALLNLYAFLLNPVARQNEKEITVKVNTALRKAVRDMNRVKPYLAADTVNFHELLNNKTYFPTFIYKNNQAVFWTDHTLVTEPVGEVFIQQPEVIENKFGKFIVSGSSYGNYQIQVYIPLERQYGINNRYLSPGLNKEIFGNQPYNIILYPTAKLTPVTYQGKYLFSVQPMQENTARTISHAAIALISGGLIFLIWGLIRVSRRIFKQGYYLKSFLILIIPLLGIRLVLLYYNFPFSVLELEAFDPKLYASAFWSPSMGDLLLNALLLLIVAFHLNQLARKKRISPLLQNLQPNTRFRVKVGCAVAFYLLLISLYFIYYTSFSNSLLVMDVTQSLQFSVYKILLYTAFVFHTIIFLVLAHLLMQVFYYLHGEAETKFYWYVGLIITGLFLIILGP